MEATENATNYDSETIDWLKQKLKILWTAPKFCGLCLENSENLCSIDMELIINKQKFSRCLQDIINYVFNDDVKNFMSSDCICDNCTEKVIQSYIFLHNARQLSKIMKNCVNDMNSKVIDINTQFDDTTDLSNANVMIVLENDTELYKTLIYTKMIEIIPTPNPIALKNEETPLPVIIKTETTKKEESPVKRAKKTEPTPNITLKEGHIVIKPLNSARNVAPRYNTYECANCTEIFTTYRTLKEHEKTKHNKTVFRCNLCDKTYNTRQYIDLHYKTHAKAKCKFCQQILPEEELMAHLRENHALLVFPCKYCDLVYYTQDSLVTHFNISHIINNTKVESQCIMCLKNFKENDIKKHKCKFTCSECFIMPCIHYKYLKSYREQTLNHASRVQCIDCDYETRRKEHLIGHANREHLDHHPFTCADCGQQFYTKLSLKTHIVQFHQEFKCEFCDIEFKGNNSLDNHRKICKSVIRPFKCNSCVASFDLESEMTAHVALRHSENVHSCLLCKRKFLTNLELEEHHARVHGGIQCKNRRKHIECSLCDLMFKNVREMLEHEKTHSPDEIFPCKVCSKQFKSLMKLYIHNQRHYTNRIKCSHCNKKLAASFYAQHVVRCPYKRETALNHVCKECGKAFHLDSLLRFHLKVHMKREPCPQCNKSMKPTSLKRHMEQVHGLGKKIVQKQPLIACELCGHTVRKKLDLEAHMNRYHLKIKPYICHICSKDFCGKIRLKEHIATHTKDNNCFCSVCGQKFANRVCLKMHFRMHTGELPYSCDVCGRKFRSSSMMKTHQLKKHVNEKTIACPFCDSMFFMVRDMRHHFKKVHWKYKDKPFNVREVEGLAKEFYHLFEDGRVPKLNS